MKVVTGVLIGSTATMCVFKMFLSGSATYKRMSIALQALSPFNSHFTSLMGARGPSK